ncbi:MAG TPA: hypothetical protein VGT40_03225 [Methylomirabilota bacterium]|jgi:hypothetical protein|nr:hypothetical protein [Methylomirabilota bacterium]
MGLTLTTHDTGFADPDPRTIAKVLAALDGGRHVLATLGGSELTYVQASGSVQAGFDLEYQEGSLDRHYRSRAAAIPLEQVTEVFQQYARGDESWRHQLEWEHVPYLPKTVPWFSTWIGYIIVLLIVIALVWIWRGR